MNDKKMISADLLKWVALITMFIDHIGAGILEKCYMPQLLKADITIRCIGRVAFPIYCFLLVEGYKYTRSRWKYAGNLLLFAFISEIPFDFLFRGGLTLSYQNVYFTLLIGMLAMIFAGMIEEKKLKMGFVLEILVFAMAAVLANIIKTDYHGWGVALIAILFFTRNLKRIYTCLLATGFVVCTALCALISISEMVGTVAFVLIFLYNGERKGTINKYVFYSLYPIHMALYYGIRCILMM